MPIVKAGFLTKDAVRGTGFSRRRWITLRDDARSNGLSAPYGTLISSIEWSEKEGSATKGSILLDARTLLTRPSENAITISMPSDTGSPFPKWALTMRSEPSVIGAWDDAHSLGMLLFKEGGRDAEAEQLMREAIEGMREVHGARDPRTLNALGNLALLKTKQGELAEANEMMSEVLTGMREVHGARHPDTLAAMINLAWVLMAIGDLADAEYQRWRGVKDSAIVRGYERRAEAHWAKAERLYLEALARCSVRSTRRR